MQRHFAATVITLTLASSAPLLPQAATATPTQQAPAERALALGREIEQLYTAQRLDDALARLDAELARASQPGPDRGWIQLMRGWVLTDMERLPEALTAFEQATAMLPRMPDAMTGLAGVQLLLKQPVKASQTIVQLTQQHPAYLSNLEDYWLRDLGEALVVAGEADARFEMMLALVWSGYKDKHFWGRDDWIRREAIVGLLERNRINEAARLADSIKRQHTLLSIMTDRRFQALWPHLEEQAGPDLSKWLAAEGEASREAHLRKPDDLKQLLRYLDSLRALGRNDVVIALAEPITRNMKDVAAAGTDAFWVVNRQAYALASSGQVSQADQLMGRLLELDIEVHPDLVSMAINRAAILLDGGAFEAALRASDWAEEKGGKHTSPYGWMWIWHSRTCALEALGQTAKAQEVLALMAEKRDDNLPAYFDALLCTNHLDMAEEVAIKWLEDKDKRDDLLLIVQNYKDNRKLPYKATIQTRLDSLLERPAVRRAIDDAGRIITVSGQWR